MHRYEFKTKQEVYHHTVTYRAASLRQATARAKSEGVKRPRFKRKLEFVTSTIRAHNIIATYG